MAGTQKSGSREARGEARRRRGSVEPPSIGEAADLLDEYADEELGEVRERVVSESDAGERLDVLLARAFPDLSRSFVQRLVEQGQVTLDGRPARASAKPRVGQSIVLNVPPPQPSELVPRDLPLAVVYEDDDVLVVDKPAGLVVHPAPGHLDDTLANALRARYPDLQIGGALRPGIVHRLDKDTSGLLVVAKNDQAMASLVEQMKARTVLKEYLALVHGDLGRTSLSVSLREERGRTSPPTPLPREGRGNATSPEQWQLIDAPIGRHPRDRQRMAVVAGGREARTRFAVRERFGRYTLVVARLETGRTHQIRVHFASIGHPLVGDPVYTSGRETLGLDRQFLHAARLGFRLPSSGREVVFESPLPPDLAGVLERLRAEVGDESQRR